MPGKIKVRLSPAAEADLIDIDTYGDEQFGREIADAYTRRIYQVFDLLRQHPLAGQEEADLGAGVRRFTQRNHRIFYRIDGDLVLILRIIHHARDMKRDLLG